MSMFGLKKDTVIILLKKSAPFILLLIWSLLLHFILLGYPAQVVFDEYYFGNFVSAYSTDSFYYDIHPPLGKLMVAGFIKLIDAQSNFSFDWVGKSGPLFVFFAFRFLPAFFGTFFVLAVAWLAYLISRSPALALIAGFLVLLDNAFLIESRFILTDIFLLFFEVLALCFFFLSQRQKSFGQRWCFFVFLTGVSFGLAIAVKWTGLAALGIIGVVLVGKIFSQKLAEFLNPQASLIPWGVNWGKNFGSFLAKVIKELWRWQRIREPLVGFLMILLLGLTVYLIPFFIQFKYLDTLTQKSDWVPVMTCRDDKLTKIEVASQELRRGDFWKKFYLFNKAMFLASARVVSEHPYKSSWYRWPFDSRPMSYWEEIHRSFRSENETGQIFLIGNPVIWLPAFLAVLFTLVLTFFKKGRQRLKPIHYILLLAYLGNLLPFIFIKRDAFLYYYLPALIFAILLLSWWLEKLARWKKWILPVFLTLVFVSFLLLAPFSYGLIFPSDSFWIKYDFKVVNFFLSI